MVPSSALREVYRRDQVHVGTSRESAVQRPFCAYLVSASLPGAVQVHQVHGGRSTEEALGSPATASRRRGAERHAIASVYCLLNCVRRTSAPLVLAQLPTAIGRSPSELDPSSCSDACRVFVRPNDMKGTRANDGSASRYAKQPVTGSATRPPRKHRLSRRTYVHCSHRRRAPAERPAHA